MVDRQYCSTVANGKGDLVGRELYCVFENSMIFISSVFKYSDCLAAGIQ